MKDRLQKLLAKEDLTPVRFSELVGVQRSSVSHILSGRNNPSLDFIQKILAGFPQLNSDWLITGQGDMYKANMTKDNTTPRMQTGTLFSQVKDEDPAPYYSKRNIDLLKSTKEAEGEKPSKEIQHSTSQIKQEDNEGARIERIVVFYTNKKFREYLPE